MDNIFYKGYAEQLAKDNPTEFCMEYKTFIWLYEAEEITEEGVCKITSFANSIENSPQ